MHDPERLALLSERSLRMDHHPRACEASTASSSSTRPRPRSALDPCRASGPYVRHDDRPGRTGQPARLKPQLAVSAFNCGQHGRNPADMVGSLVVSVPGPAIPATL